MIAERNFRKALETVMFLYGSYLAHDKHDDDGLQTSVKGLVAPLSEFSLGLNAVISGS